MTWLIRSAEDCHVTASSGFRFLPVNRHNRRQCQLLREDRTHCGLFPARAGMNRIQMLPEPTKAPITKPLARRNNQRTRARGHLSRTNHLIGTKLRYFVIILFAAALVACTPKQNRVIIAPPSGAKQAPPIPDLSRLDDVTRELIQRACHSTKFEGPAAYSRCLQQHLASIGVSTN